MKIISVNVARPRLVEWNDQIVSTGIFKIPVEGRVMLRTLNLDGDRQADLTVHGGLTKRLTYTRPNTTATGATNCRAPHCHGECSARTSPLTI